MENNHDTILGLSLSQAVKQIVNMPSNMAEKAIEAIADREGDEVVKNILRHLPPVKIAAILRQHDFSCPSIISWILTPKIIADVLKIDPLFWKNIYDRKQPDNFFQIQNDALDLINSILLNAENRDKQEEILQHISCDSLSLLYLFLPFVGWHIKKNQTLLYEDLEFDFGTADHLYEAIRWANPYVAKKIINFICSAGPPLLYYITDLWSEAFDCFDKDHDHGSDYKSVETVMFVPVAL